MFPFLHCKISHFHDKVYFNYLGWPFRAEMIQSIWPSSRWLITSWSWESSCRLRNWNENQFKWMSETNCFSAKWYKGAQIPRNLRKISLNYLEVWSLHILSNAACRYSSICIFNPFCSFGNVVKMRARTRGDMLDTEMKE